MGMMKDIWNYRGFILGSVKREFQLKYRNSLLGAAWAVLNPLAMIIVYTVIFSRVMSNHLPDDDRPYAYGIYLCAGLLTWGLFSEIISRLQTIFLENANLLKKTNFPKICLPIVAVLCATINFIIIFTIFSVFLVLTGNFPGWTYMAIFPLLIVEIIFSVGLGILLGVLNVFFRDVGQLTGIALQFWFWLTPIVYTQAILGEKAMTLISFNPMTNLILAYQGIFIKEDIPSFINLIPVFLLGSMLCIFSIRFFRNHADDIVDEL